MAQLPIPGDEIFINEFHYDNIGADTGEGFEIAGPAGTNLGGYQVYLYNGSNGSIYNTPAISGTIPNQQNGFGTLWFDYVLQNDSDGIVLSDGTNFHFLSYEGSFSGTAGIANLAHAIDIGVSESNTTTAIGASLQLIGAGNVKADFTWTGPIVATPGDINTGQTFSAVASIDKSGINGFAVYPNPVQGGSFRIKSSNNHTLKSVQVYDMLGKQVFSQKGIDNENIDVSNLIAGIYILKVEEQGKVATRKLVIE